MPRIPSADRVSIFAVLLAALVAAGCASRPGGTAASGETAARERPRSTATVSLIEPAPGAVVAGDALRVRVGLTGGRIILETKTDLRPDEGHIHVLVDGKAVSMSYGLEQEVPVTKGPHLIQVEYVAADHLPFHPRVLAAATIVVK
jgi:hypothetical protein